MAKAKKIKAAAQGERTKKLVWRHESRYTAALRGQFLSVLREMDQKEAKEASELRSAASSLRDQIVRLNNLSLGERVARLDTMMAEIGVQLIRLRQTIEINHRPGLLKCTWLRIKSAVFP